MIEPPIAKEISSLSRFYMLAYVLIESSRARFTMPKVFRLFLYPPAVAQGRCSISLLFLCISMIEETVWLAINYIYRRRVKRRRSSCYFLDFLTSYASLEA